MCIKPYPVKHFIKPACAILLSVFLIQRTVAQGLASSYHPKNKTEKVILMKVNALPEIMEWLTTAKKSKADLMINEPDHKSRYYSIQVGLGNLSMFRTNYWLFIDPKTFQIYYWDQLNRSAYQNITLQQWRYWRTKPGWQKPHIYKKGKLIVVK